MARVTKKKVSFGTSMGISSVIAILVILLLVIFSALSITTSNVDLRLSQKTADSVKAYYIADSKAEDMMATAANAIKGGADWKTVLPGDGFELSDVADGTQISYTVSIDDNRNLNVTLLADKSGKLTRELWQVVPAKEWVPDNNLNLFVPK